MRRSPPRPALDFERTGREAGLLGNLLLGAGLIACALVAARIIVLRQDIARLEALPAVPRAVEPPRSTKAASSPFGTQRSELASAVVARLSMPWSDWFAQLEASTRGKVVFTALQPEADGRRVRVAGVARRFEDLVEYMMALEATPGFANVFLSEHAETPTGVSFTLSADWVERP